jgi:CRISPR-associated protein Cst2
MLQHCAVTDVAGTLFAEKAAARKSCVEFGWVVGLPDRVVTEQYFHVKYDPQSREKSAGGESVEGTQAIFHRPASSGVYGLVCNLDLYRIGLNDVTRRYDVKKEDRIERGRALVQALAATLVKPAGAQRNTQTPHIVSCEGVVSWSTSSLPAPMMSPLHDDYRSQVLAIAEVLNGVSGGSIIVREFSTMSEGTKVLAEVGAGMDLPPDAA